MKAAIVLSAFGLATVLSACGGSDQTQATYCVDANGTVLDEDYCDPDNEHYAPTYIIWYSEDDHHYKTGKKIPGADFRKGTTSAPAKPSATKPSGSTSKPSANTPKASTPKAQAPKPAPAPKPQAPKPQAPKPPASKPSK